MIQGNVIFFECGCYCRLLYNTDARCMNVDQRCFFCFTCKLIVTLIALNQIDHVYELRLMLNSHVSLRIEAVRMVNFPHEHRLVSLCHLDVCTVTSR